MFNILAITALSKPASVITKIILFVFTQSIVHVPVDVEIDMQEQNIPFQVVEEMPKRFDVAASAFGYYSRDDTMIYFVSEDGTFSYGEFLVAATHEMIHYHRDQSGQWSENQWLEEAIACYGSPVLDNDMGMDTVDLSRKECDRFFIDCQIANKIENPRLPSKQEFEIIKNNINSLRQYIIPI